MLDLNTRIHLQKIKISRLIHNKLDRSGALIANRLTCRQSSLGYFLAGLWVECRRGRFFQHFLMPSLDRAFALKQMDELAVLVAQKLHFDMARLLNSSF